MLSENVESPTSPAFTASSPRKKSHRRRISALRLSSDTTGTTSTLPEYSQTPTSSSTRLAGSLWETSPGIPEDSPPEYPGSQRSFDSAEEADEETELTGSDGDEEDSQTLARIKGRKRHFRYVPQSISTPQTATTSRRSFYDRDTPHTASPRRTKRFLHQQQALNPDVLEDLKGTHRRRHSAGSVLRSLRPQPNHKQTASLSATPKSRLSKLQKPSDTDTYLDSLLERSVNALEMSNTLLQSSISTQATISGLFSGSSTSLGAFRTSTTPPHSYYSNYSPAESSTGTPTRGYSGYHDVDSALEARAIGLSSKLMRTWDVQEGWVEQLERIKDGVDSLFNDDELGEGGSGARRSRSASRRPTRSGTAGSYSLPSSSPLSSLRLSSTAPSSPIRKRLSIDRFRHSNGLEGGRHRSVQSADMDVSELYPARFEEPLAEEGTSPTQSQLRLAPQDRSNLVSPPPRALTMYVDATSSPSFGVFEGLGRSREHTPFALPSTLGVRSASASMTSLLLPNTTTSTIALPPQVTDTTYDPSTPAYNMLSSLAVKGIHRGASASTSSLLSTISVTNTLRVPTISRRDPGEPIPASAPSSFVSSFINRAATSLQRHDTSPSGPPQVRRSSSVGRTASPSMRRSPRNHPSGSNIPSYGNASPKLGTLHPPPIRRLTPPTEEESQTEGSESSDGCVAKRTVVSLRKILDHAPSTDNAESASHLGVPPELSRSASCLNTSAPSSSSRPPSVNDQAGYQIAPTRAPAFMPRSPAPVASAGTSTATASISRLFTKGVHSSSTRPRSPPLRSVMKGKAPPPPIASTDSDGQLDAPSASATPQHLSPAAASLTGNSPCSTALSTPNPSFANFPEFLSRALASGNRSTSSSGRSTPKRISFAELPESYASTKPVGETAGRYAKGREGSGKRRRQRGRQAESSGLNVRRPGSPDSGEAERSWWANWLAPRNAVEEREGRERMYREDRTTRAWGGRMGMTIGVGGLGHPGMDEWGV